MAQKNNKLILENAENEISLFERWFVQSQGAEPLANFERAILKTFLVAKATGLFTEPSAQEGSPSETPEASAGNPT